MPKTEKSEKKTADVAAMIALFGSILVVSLALALTTDLNVVVRVVLSIVTGLVVAAATHAVVGNRR